MLALNRCLLGMVALLVAGHVFAAEQVSVAAAANFVYVLEPLNAEFERVNPSVSVTKMTGASGNLVAMISNGAPYDVFLSADLDFLHRLIRAGGAEDASLAILAYGKLVLWTLKPGLELASVESVVSSPGVQRIAVANPKTAPYGLAAQQTLQRLGQADKAKAKLVFAENISQTAQFVSSGNADVGFVALSLVVAPNLKEKGRWLEVPEHLYEPITQGGILTKLGGANPAARRYLEFLRSPAARTIFARFGYGLP